MFFASIISLTAFVGCAFNERPPSQSDLSDTTVPIVSSALEVAASVVSAENSASQSDETSDVWTHDVILH